MNTQATSLGETWSTERVEQLRSFVTAGLTCSQIAAEIGVTRNAVIGKIHRLGLGPGRPAAAPGRACVRSSPSIRQAGPVPLNPSIFATPFVGVVT